MKINSYKDLQVWQKAIELVKKVYLVTKAFPNDEMYGLINQMRRSAVSIASNIAEGKSRQTKKEYIRFLYITIGSTAELETQVIIAHELKYIDKRTTEQISEHIDHIGRMTRNLISSLQATESKNREPLTENREPRTDKH